MTAQPDVSRVLGTESQPIHFPAGLVGFDEWKNFVLVAHAAGGPLRLLQSLDDERVSFIVVDPRHVVPDYHPQLSPEDVDVLCFATGLDVAWPGEVGMYCILSMHEETRSITANLLSPLVVNWQAGIGLQVILSNSGYEARYLVAKSVP